MTARRAGPIVAALATFGAVVRLGFAAGGFFAGTTGIAVLVCGLALVAWLVLARRPIDGLSSTLGIAAGALVLLAMWTLTSQAWSDAQARAVLEFDRVLLYTFVVLLAGLVAGSLRGRRRLLLAVVAAFTVLCAAGLVSRLLPELWPTTPTVHPDRLSYPVTYWNTLGMLGTLALVGCLHYAAAVRESTLVRALAAGATPILAATILFTFSRGALVLVPLGVALYLALARPRGAATALLAVVPASAIAVVTCYGADAVVEATEPTAAAVSQGRTLALAVGACALAAGGMLIALRPVDRWVARRRRGLSVSRRTIGVAAVAVVAASIVAGVPGKVADGFDEFRSGNVVEDTGDRRTRLTDVGNNGRLDHWHVAVDAFVSEPLTGTGAGTYALQWSRHRESSFDVNDGHSLILETLGELGLIGGSLVLLAIGGLLIGSARRIRGPDRAVGAAIVTFTVLWLLRAQIDWDWEMPVLTAPVLALAAAGATERREHQAGVWPGRLPRLLAGIGVLVTLTTPLAIVQSQGQLDDAVAHLRAGRCEEAIAAAVRSADAASFRPEPFQVLAFCDLRLGEGPLALGAMKAAVERDPDNWALLYGLGIVRGAEGEDPRPTLLQAREHNPKSKLVADALDRLKRTKPAKWPGLALRAPLPF